MRVTIEFDSEPGSLYPDVLCRHLVKLTISEESNRSHPPCLSLFFNSDETIVSDYCTKLVSDAECAMKSGEEPNYHHKIKQDNQAIHLTGNLDSAINKLLDYLLLNEVQAEKIMGESVVMEIIERSLRWTMQDNGELCDSQQVLPQFPDQLGLFSQPSSCRKSSSQDAVSTKSESPSFVLG